ncbi:phage virion morphogenesis protein [Acetobacter cibinongensis]|uniref:Virion morphogenesis protein n=1 Tax=Acetobacter cibinongensis TaxID=146475 RepID=A0A1Z5YTB3_9PROT|nr:phage virion morphogenesis protein [Acetobacter cibinongensis]OUJ01531.1 virion morphogenesis protein [Acetobacter cibinongensis]
MPSVIVRGDTGPLRAALDRVADIGRNPSGVLSALGNSVLNNTRKRMEQGVDPRGVRWDSYAPLNPIYASGKKGPGILRGDHYSLMGHLYGSLVKDVRGSSLVWGSALPYSRIHQLGGIIQPKNKRWLSFEMGGHLWHLDNVEIPARPYLGFTEEDREDLMDNLQGYLARAVRG